MRRPFPKLSRGAIALVALSFVSVLGLVLAGYFAISQQSMRLSNRSYGATVSEQLAELGLEEALRAVTTNNFADWTSGTAPDQTTVDWTLTAATADTAATATAIITPPATRYGNAGVAGTEDAADAELLGITEDDRLPLLAFRRTWFTAVGLWLTRRRADAYAAHLRRLKDRRLGVTAAPARAERDKTIAAAAAKLRTLGDIAL
jgi:hypothetical protein